MNSRSRSQLSVSAAFAAALLSTTSAHANSPPESAHLQAAKQAQPAEPGAAASKRIEAAAQMAWFWFPVGPIPPKWVEIWPEVTHVESVRTA
jgi:hypothetical protein